MTSLRFDKAVSMTLLSHDSVVSMPLLSHDLAVFQLFDWQISLLNFLLSFAKID
jgi:hypothetical protein